MRMLGTKPSLPAFRWDLLYLLAQLTADKRPEIKALAPKVQTMIDAHKAGRETFEGAQDMAVIAAAILRKEDKSRDDRLVEMGGVARSVAKDVYQTLFAKFSPSIAARLPLKAEAAEVKRILGELGKLEATHPLRVSYEKSILEAETQVAAAGVKNDDAITQLALERSQIERLKHSIDKGRLEVHGQLLAILKDKDEADSFFRPTTSAPGEESHPEPPVPSSAPPTTEP